MTVLARFICRPSDLENENSNPDLILGACFKNQPEDGLKAGRVYELKSIFGAFVLVDIGPSILGTNHANTAIEHCSWMNEAGYILEVAGKRLWLTIEEYKNCLIKYISKD